MAALQTGIFSGLLAEENKRLIESYETRSSLENPQTPLSFPSEWLLDMYSGGRTDSGIRVSELTAFQASTFLSCVDLIAGTIASLPVHVYCRSFNAGGRAIHSIAYDHDLYSVINNEPNDEMSSHTITKASMAHSLAWGNSYVEIQRDASNGVVALWPRNPAKTSPRRLTANLRLEATGWRPFPVNLHAGELVYETTDGIDEQDYSETGAKSRSGRIIPKEDILHIPGLTFDGRIGQSVVQLARQTIGLALATEKFGAKYFSNFARPGGIITTPTGLSPEARTTAKNSWMEAQGGENSHRVAVMPGPDWKFTSISNNPEQSQTVQTREFIRNEVASIFHVPPHMIGAIDRGKSSTEQLAQEFISYTLSPWLNAIKQEYKRKLFPHRGIGRTPQNPYYVDFDLQDMLRPDAASREKFYATGRQWGFLNPNDCLAFEGLNPITAPIGEEYWMPVNMTLSTTPINPNYQDGAGHGDKPAEDAPEKKPKPTEEQKSAFMSTFKTVIGDPEAAKLRLGPILLHIQDDLRAAISTEMKCSFVPNEDRSRFIDEYIGAMVKRSAEWKTEDAEHEFARATKALLIAAYREVATAKAKEN